MRRGEKSERSGDPDLEPATLIYDINTTHFDYSEYKIDNVTEVDVDQSIPLDELTTEQRSIMQDVSYFK